MKRPGRPKKLACEKVKYQLVAIRAEDNDKLNQFIKDIKIKKADAMKEMIALYTQKA